MPYSLQNSVTNSNNNNNTTDSSQKHASSSFNETDQPLIDSKKSQSNKESNRMQLFERWNNVYFPPQFNSTLLENKFNSCYTLPQARRRIKFSILLLIFESTAFFLWALYYYLNPENYGERISNSVNSANASSSNNTNQTDILVSNLNASSVANSSNSHILEKIQFSETN